jgi:hypothetical protein
MSGKDDLRAARARGSEQAPVTSYSWPKLGEAALYGPAGDLVRAIAPHTEADPVALLIQQLVAHGSATGRGPYFQVEGDRHHMNLYAVLVGATSQGRKGTSKGRIRQVYNEVDSTLTNGREVSGLSSGEGLIWAVRDPIYRGEELDDAGVHDKRLMVAETEFASPLRVLRREGNTLSPVIRNAWDTGMLRSLVKNSPAVATDAHISIIGHITKEELLRHLDATEMANGFANRFLWVCVKRSQYLPEGGDLDLISHNSLISRLKESLEFAKRTGRITFTEDARLLWHQKYRALADGCPGLLGAIISRAPPQVLRLACIYALLDGSAVIERKHLEAGLALWSYCEDSARYIFGDRLGYPLADSIFQALHSQPNGLTRSQISDLLGRHVKSAEIESALRFLAERSLASFEPEETEGRTAHRWKAGPAKKANDAKKATSNGVPKESGASGDSVCHGHPAAHDGSGEGDHSVRDADGTDTNSGREVFEV